MVPPSHTSNNPPLVEPPSSCRGSLLRTLPAATHTSWRLESHRPSGTRAQTPPGCLAGATRPRPLAASPQPPLRPPPHLPPHLLAPLPSLLPRLPLRLPPPLPPPLPPAPLPLLRPLPPRPPPQPAKAAPASLEQWHVSLAACSLATGCNFMALLSASLVSVLVDAAQKLAQLCCQCDASLPCQHSTRSRLLNPHPPLAGTGQCSSIPNTQWEGKVRLEIAFDYKNAEARQQHRSLARYLCCAQRCTVLELGAHACA